MLNCKKFRNMVRGGQCKILCGKPSFERFVNIADGDKFVVGSMSSLSAFTNKLGEVVGCKIELGYHNLGLKGYEKKLGLSDSVLSEIGSLVEEDVKLYNYIANECNGLFVSGLA